MKTNHHSKIEIISEFKIVLGKCLFDKIPKRYIKKDNNGIITYHKVKEVTKKWNTKYGPYNTIKEKGGSITFYNVGQEVEIYVLEEYNFEVDASLVAIGYNF